MNFGNFRANRSEFKMIEGLLYFGYFAASLVGVGAAALYWFQDKLLYYPSMPPGAREQFADPAEFRLGHCFQEIFITTPDGERIQAWFFKQEHADEVATILFFHGNAGNLSHRLPNIQELFEKVGCNVMIVSYRGYGKSTGTSTESGLKIDAQSALDYLIGRDDINSKKIIVFGRSLGGAVGIQLIAKNEDKICALIVENTFLSVGHMVDLLFPFLSRMKFLSTNKWDSETEIVKISIPILFLVGEKDSLVPCSHPKQLYEKAINSLGREIKSFPQGNHMDCWLQPMYYLYFKNFVDRVTK